MSEQTKLTEYCNEFKKILHNRNYFVMMYNINKTKINNVNTINNYKKIDVYVKHDQYSVYKNIKFYKIINITVDNQIYEFTIDNNKKFEVKNDEPLIFKNYGTYTGTIIDNNLLLSKWISNNTENNNYKVYNIININAINDTLEIEFKNFESKFVNIIIKLQHFVTKDDSNISNITKFIQNKKNLINLINEYKQKMDERNSLEKLMEKAYIKWNEDSIILKNLQEKGIFEYLFNSNIQPAKIKEETSKEELKRAIVAYRNVYSEIYNDKFKNEYNIININIDSTIDSSIDLYVYRNFKKKKEKILDELNDLLSANKAKSAKRIDSDFQILEPLLITKQNIEK